MPPKLIATSRGSGSDYRSAIEFAVSNGFDGIDWNLDYYRISAASGARRSFIESAINSGLPSRFHAPCQDVEIGHVNPGIALASVAYLKMYIDFIKVIPDTHFNLHIGSRNIPEPELSWDTAVRNLKELVDHGGERGVTVCLENLKHGWTRHPEKLAELANTSGAMVTLDIGHARATLRADQRVISLEEYVRPYEDRIRNLHLYEIETSDGRHVEPENLDAIKGILQWALAKKIDWWVIELSNPDAMVRTKELIKKDLFKSHSIGC